MKRVVVDASALAAIVFQEPESANVEAALDGAIVYAPELLKFELANIAWKKARQRPSQVAGILSALWRSLEGRWQLSWQDVRPTDAALVAVSTGLSAYDATYLWLAGHLSADLVTLDARLAAASDTMLT